MKLCKCGHRYATHGSLSAASAGQCRGLRRGVPYLEGRCPCERYDAGEGEG